MPVILSQRTWHDDPKYLDREGVIYHSPPQYRTRVNAYDRFIYYRPATGASPEERSTYIGHGLLGDPFPDPNLDRYWYVPIAWYEPFRSIVPLMQGDIAYETEEPRRPQFQSAVRPIRETAYYRILAAGGVSAGREFSPLLTSESALGVGYAGYRDAPKDRLRALLTVPPGTGYVPKGDTLPNVFEAAALQERARSDHQFTLDLIRKEVQRAGGTCWYNNNIDLFARVGEGRYLIEAKSLNDPRAVVDTMRYGMGQLFDYRVRYRAEIEGAMPVLAFGAIPLAETRWVAGILEENGVGCIGSTGDRLVPLNNRASELPFYQG
jgi:hypothetical protein